MTESVTKFHVGGQSLWGNIPCMSLAKVHVLHFCISVLQRMAALWGWGVGLLGELDLSQHSPEPGSQGHRDSPGPLPGNRDRPGWTHGWTGKGCRGLETSPAVVSRGWGLMALWAGMRSEGVGRVCWARTLAPSGHWCCICFCSWSTKKVPWTCSKCITRLLAFTDTLHFALFAYYVADLKTVHITLWIW